MKKVAVFILLSFLIGGCNNPKKEKAIKKLASIDTVAKPKVDVRVDKKYDEKGNLVQYDSTYSYFYSSPGFKNSINRNSFKSFHNEYKDLLNKNMNSIFFNDSLFKYDFYNDDYLNKRFENIFKQMDSITGQTYSEKTIKKK